MQTYVKGIYKKSIYKGDNGYNIGLIMVKSTNDPNLSKYINKNITFTGSFYDLNLGEFYQFSGRGNIHPKYGFQYEVHSYERLPMQDREAVISFLSSDLFHGIGEKMAITIVDSLGKNAIEKIIKNPNILFSIKGIAKKKAEYIHETLSKYEESNSIILYLRDLGFSIKESLIIYNTYNRNTISQIEHNIYGITYDIADLTFPKLDRISVHLHIKENDSRRIKAAILYKMKENTFTTGNTYFLKEEMYNIIKEYLQLDIEKETFYQYVSELQIDGYIKSEGLAYYLKSIYECEREIVYKVGNLIGKKIQNRTNMDKYIEDLEVCNHITYSEKQKQSILKALENHISIITGGAGTGKTTLIRAIIQIYQKVEGMSDENLRDELVLLAPTGRASKRMSEGTLFRAYTIHKFLKWNKETGEFAINEHNKSSVKMVIVDEVSMVDIELFSHLLKALSVDVCIVLVGDFNQLPSVGPGQVLRDLILCEKIEKTELDLLYRQDKHSSIPLLAECIKVGAKTDDFLSKNGDYQFLSCQEGQILKNLHIICKKAILKGYDYKKMQILCPMYKGINGIDNLNKQLQDVFNPKMTDKNEVMIDDIIYREDDKVIQLINMPEENIFNGDMGIIIKVETNRDSKSKKIEISVDFDGNIVTYTGQDISKIRHGYVISIHKAQGSEFDFVILPISHSYNRMLYQKLLYTAVTRAKKKLILLGNRDVFLYGISNHKEDTRKTKLCEKIKKIYIN